MVRGQSKPVRAIFVFVCLLALFYLILAEAFGADADCLTNMLRLSGMEEKPPPSKVISPKDEPFRMTPEPSAENILGADSKQNYKANWFVDLDIIDVRSKLVFEYLSESGDSSVVFVDLIGAPRTSLQVDGMKNRIDVPAKPHDLRIHFARNQSGAYQDVNLLEPIFHHLGERAESG